ncbi:HlyD family efflux transporter periplasmic adaptor subunit [Enterococcus sp. UD-01]|jgi:hemolysin D|uniref:HlyD family efflux transporter periplasmic adaptor subunit n=1 Tax=Enterococcus sp. UD-01 TaxID=3373911 RepID=UPI003834BF02
MMWKLNQRMQKASEKRLLRKNKKDMKLLNEFQPDVIELIDKPISPIGRWIVKLICLFLFLILLFTFFGKINVVSTARGTTKPKGEIYRVQMPKTSTIIAMNVEEGQKVKKGTTLFSVDDEQVIGIDNVSNEKLLQQSQLEKKALTAIFKDKKLTDYLSIEEIRQNPEVESYYNIQLTSVQSAVEVLQSEKIQQERYASMYEFQKKSIDAEISNTKTQITYLEEKKNQAVGKEELAQLELQLKYAQSDEADYRKKYEENKEYKSAWESKKADRENKEAQIAVKKAELEEAIKELDSQIASYQAKVAQLTADLSVQQENINLANAKNGEFDLQIESTRAEEKNKISTMILEKNKEIEQYQAALDKGEEYVKNQIVTAPVSGTIGEITTDELGETLPQAQEVLTIVPEKAPLYFEILVKNQDIGYVQIGQKVSIKVEAFSFQKNGVLEGKVTYISPEAEKQEDQQMMYKAKVELLKKQTKFRADPKNVLVGMNVTADIEIGRRRIIDFFFEPVTKYLDESFKLR